MNSNEQSFSEKFGFEAEVRALYPNSTVDYQNKRLSNAGTPMFDWIVTPAGKKSKPVTHTMLVLKSQKTGKPYAVVTREPNEAIPEPSEALAAILASAYAD